MRLSVTLIFLLFVVCVISSCSVFRKVPNRQIYLRTSKKAKLLYRNEYDGLIWRRRICKLREDSVMNVRGYKALIAVPDSDAPVPVTVRKNSIESTIYIQPVHEFFFGTNDNRFTFPRKVFADIDDTGKAYYRYKRGTLLIKHDKAPGWSVDFTPPIINGFGYGLKDMSGLGLIGSAIALNYNYDEGRSISFEAGGIAPAFESQPSIITAYTPYKYNKISGWFVSVKENYLFGRCELGYGAYLGGHYGKSYYNTLYSADDSLGYSRNAYGLGVCASAYFRITGFLAIGGSFQPQLISVDKSVSAGFESLYYFGVRLRAPIRRRND